MYYQTSIIFLTITPMFHYSNTPLNLYCSIFASHLVFFRLHSLHFIAEFIENDTHSRQTSKISCALS